MLSDLARERAVLCSREVGVGLGVPRSLGSGLALLGGRGREIRELATFSLTTAAGLCLVGRLGGAVSATEKLLEAGHAQLSPPWVSGGGTAGSEGGLSSGPGLFISVLRLLMSDRRSLTSLLRWLVSLVSSLVLSAPGVISDTVTSPMTPALGPVLSWVESKLMSVEKRPIRSWA